MDRTHNGKRPLAEGDAQKGADNVKRSRDSHESDASGAHSEKPRLPHANAQHGADKLDKDSGYESLQTDPRTSDEAQSHLNDDAQIVKSSLSLTKLAHTPHNVSASESTSSTPDGRPVATGTATAVQHSRGQHHDLPSLNADVSASAVSTILAHLKDPNSDLNQLFAFDKATLVRALELNRTAQPAVDSLNDVKPEQVEPSEPSDAAESGDTAELDDTAEFTQMLQDDMQKVTEKYKAEVARLEAYIAKLENSLKLRREFFKDRLAAADKAKAGDAAKQSQLREDLENAQNNLEKKKKAYDALKQQYHDDMANAKAFKDLKTMEKVLKDVGDMMRASFVHAWHESRPNKGFVKRWALVIDFYFGHSSISYVLVVWLASMNDGGVPHYYSMSHKEECSNYVDSLRDANRGGRHGDPTTFTVVAQRQNGARDPEIFKDKSFLDPRNMAHPLDVRKILAVKKDVVMNPDSYFRLLKSVPNPTPGVYDQLKDWKRRDKINRTTFAAEYAEHRGRR